jgi:hypothetical protein
MPRNDLSLSIVQARRAVEENSQAFGQSHEKTLKALADLAKLLRSSGDLASARHIQEGILTTLGQRPDVNQWLMIQVSQALAITYGEMKEYQLARELEEHVLKLVLHEYGVDSPQAKVSMDNLAQTLRDTGDLGALSALDNEIVASRKRTMGRMHPETVNAMEWAAVRKQANGEYVAARDLRVDVLEFYLKTVGPSDRATLEAKNNLATALIGLGEFARAKELLVDASDFAARFLPRRDRLRRTIDQNMASLDGLATKSGSVWMGIDRESTRDERLEGETS